MDKYLEEAKEIAEVDNYHTNKLFWFLFFSIIFVILLIVLVIIFGGHKTISSTNVVEGVAVEIGENEAVKFEMNEEEHGLKIDMVGADFIGVTISSEPVNLTLKLGEAKEVDLDRDNKTDLKIKLVRIVDGKATVSFIKMRAQMCREDWKCQSWSNCSRGKQMRSCTDMNFCQTYFDRPVLKKECTERIDEELKDIKNESAGNFSNNTNYTGNAINNTINNNSNINNLSVTSTICPSNTHYCVEKNGYFCKTGNFSDSANRCCTGECLKIYSNSQFCSINKYSFFENNQTHLCTERINIFYNGTNISCCGNITSRTIEQNFSLYCAGQGESFEFGLSDSAYQDKCCEGLENVHTTDSISIADKCYWALTESGYPGGVCSDCGNGICESVESVCGCPEDCTGKGKSNYPSIEGFCNSDYGKTIIIHCREFSLTEQEICKLCNNAVSS